MNRQRDFRTAPLRASANCLVQIAAAALCMVAGAQASPGDLVGASVSDSPRIALEAQRPNWVRDANDLGVVAGDLSFTHLTVLLKRSPQQQAAFEKFLGEQQDRSSANFHHWLSPVEVGTRFGASGHDVDAVVAWLKSQGLNVDGVSNSRMRINFSGTAAHLATAFAAPLHTFNVAGDRRIAPSDQLRIPAALSAVVRSVNGLTTIRERPNHGSASATFPPRPAWADRPGATFCQGSDCNNYVFPADFAKIYDIAPAYAQGIDGTGQTIAIVGRAKVYLPDIENFQSRSGLATSDPIITVPPNGIDPGDAASSGTKTPEDQLEATIDVTRATSVAPGATINLVVSANTTSLNGIAVAAEYIIDTNPPPAHILSMSFGACESDAGQAGVDFYDNLFSQAAAQGISVFVDSGDSGAAGCDAYNAAPPTTQILSTNYICSSSYTTCVGGTEFADSTNASSYWGSNGNGYLSALGYIPEGAWNEPLTSTGATQASATGGGVSAFIATPTWQTGVGVPGTQGRYTPDVSFSASSHDGYFACLAASGNSCVAASNGSFRFESFFGTSASTPDMAGITALLNQKIGSAQGLLNPRLYALAATPGNGVFHDVTVASSGVGNCDVAVPSLCNNTTPGTTDLSGGLAGYVVGTGYDLATGLGSIDVTNLLNQWSQTATFVNLDQHGLTGTWTDASASGQGFLIEVYPDIAGAGRGLLGAGWYTFDVSAEGGQRWYTLQGPANSGSASASLGIYTGGGGNFNAPPKVSGTQVGTASLSFSDWTHGTLTFSFSDGSGSSGVIALTRLDANETCTAAGDSGVATPGYLLSGAWYDPTTSGQGFLFDVSPAQTTLFIGWYTFSPDGAAIGGGASQRWYTLQDNAYSAGSAASNVPIYEPTGGTFNTPGGETAGAAVGTATITFQGCGSAVLSYNFTGGTNSGLSGVINLGRVGPTPQGCSY